MTDTNRRSFMSRWGAAAVVVAVLLGAGAFYYKELAAWFRGDPERKTATSQAAAAVTPINDVCPIRGEKVPEDAKTVEWNGHVIGFCCPSCEEDWNALPDAKKQAFVERFLKDGESTERAESLKLDVANLAPDDIAHYTCSMHTSVKLKVPGKCPICSMDLEPVTWEEVRTGVIRIDAQRRQLIGVKTETVEVRELVKEVRAAGVVAYDQTRLTDVSLKFSGWVGELHADFVGKRVEKGEPLMTVYSPELLTAQQEFLDARASGQGDRLFQGARNRLLLWDMTEQQVEELAQRGKPSQYVPVLSPATGTVVEKSAVRGGAVQASGVVFRIADLSSVWVEAALYEAELAAVQSDQEVKITLSYLPDQTFTGKVSYIYPYLDPKTRRGRIRVEVPNAQGLLKPGMYADVDIEVPLGKRLAVPRDAVLYGGQSRVVFLDLGEGKMKPQRIKAGVSTGEYLEVVEGLKEGDLVVTSGNFLIASESKLKGGIEKW